MQQPSESVTPSVCYSDNIYSEDYISQFLDFSNHQINYQSEEPIRKDTLLTESEKQQESQEIESETICKGDRVRSCFHNFQKHLVTTLRKCISFQEMEFQDSNPEVEKQLWELFTKCHKMTRTLIYLVYGGISIQCSKAKKFNRQYGMQKIIKMHPLSRIKRAQKNLRDQTLKQISKIDIQSELDHRRMKDKQGFKVYFEAFVQQLKDGGFNKRLPKDKKQKVEQKMQLETKYMDQDFQGLSFNKA